MKKNVQTLCMIYDDEQILPGMKKRGFGEGRWNGFGGKPRKGESIEETLYRELQEEIGVTPKDVRKRGVLTFRNDGSEELIEVHVFSAREYEGEPREGEEMRPQWFRHADVPYDEMWKDDRYWIPLLLAGKNFEGRFVFKDFDEVIESDVREI